MYLEKLVSRSLAKHITWICVGMITLFAPCGWAATVTSVAAGGNWGTAATWVGSALPAVGDNVVIATTGANKVTVDGNYTNASITINSGAILSFDATARSLALACISASVNFTFFSFFLASFLSSFFLSLALSLCSSTKAR